ncbi:MAG TPA: acetyl-CoA acetyltransferase [Mycobacteriales bacterium]|nr:acetyl-CoA acetyltransferase [Mycobacteriales bacterium]
MSAGVDPRTPCIIGVAQHTVRPPGPSPEPLELWEQRAREAAADSASTAGAAGVLERLDSVQVVYCQTWPYDDPVGRLLERIGADPKDRHYSGIGGTTPQVLLNGLAERILASELELGLVVGAEALATTRALKKAGERAAWSHRDPEKKPFPFEAVPPKTEVAHQVFQAYLTFPLFDTARRAARGASLGDYADATAQMFTRMTEVAAANPHAWFPKVRSAAELGTATPENRYVGWPYTKYEVSVMDVDMSAAAIIASEATADALGVPVEKRVYPLGWAYATDVWTVAERDDMARSDGMKAVADAVLGMAGVGIDDIAAFDLYSCFASSLHLQCDAMGLDPLDPRGLTVTGGLPFAGGPASNYMLHSIATMVDRLRAEPGSKGMVTGVGMHMTKHCNAVYSSAPPSSVPVPIDKEALQAGLDAGPKRAVLAAHEGPATVVAYTVEHGRDGAPMSGLLILEVDGGGRCYARVNDPALLSDAESRELVGQAVTVSTDGSVNTATW